VPVATRARLSSLVVRNGYGAACGACASMADWRSADHERVDGRDNRETVYRIRIRLKTY
jgi:hypothetical protein